MAAEPPSLPIVGLDDRRYHVVRPWGNVPAGRSLQGVSHVACDSQDNVYVYQRAADPVVVFDRHGTLIGCWGQGAVIDAHGIFITADDQVLLVDRDGHRLLFFDAGGRLSRSIGDADHPRRQVPFNHPADVAVDAHDGSVFVADGYGNSSLHHFSPNGELIASWGTPGSGPGQFTTPHAVWVDNRRVLVADRENDRIQVFDPSGQFLAEWRDHYHPMDIYVDSGGRIYVTDQVPRLSLLAADGTLLGRCKPVPVGAHGIWGDSRGDLYLAEGFPFDRITKLVRIE